MAVIVIVKMSRIINYLDKNNNSCGVASKVGTTVALWIVQMINSLCTKLRVVKKNGLN